MARTAILPARTSPIEIDIFSNKSSLILFWLLTHHNLTKQDGFSINELSRYTSLSVGLVHKVIKQLEYDGLIVSKGLRTGKVFFFKSPNELLSQWVQHYSLIKKTKLLGFAQTKNIDSAEQQKFGLIPALHSASEKLYKLKTTNLKAKEYYLTDWKSLPKVINKFELQEMDRGYELLLIKPYYSALLDKIYGKNSPPAHDLSWQQAYALLTVLDLCHFPLRGIEQAETLYRKLPYLNSIAPWNEIENAIG